MVLLIEFACFEIGQFQITPVPTRNRIRAGTDAAIGYPRAGIIDILKLLGDWLGGLFISRAAREAEWRFSASSCLSYSDPRLREAGCAQQTG
jgi:hypothetical protein